MVEGVRDMRAMWRGRSVFASGVLAVIAKSEVRNPKSERNPKPENPNPQALLRNSIPTFPDLWGNPFGIRIFSDFEDSEFGFMSVGAHALACPRPDSLTVELPLNSIGEAACAV
jgi:hypothetical protein